MNELTPLPAYTISTVISSHEGGPDSLEPIPTDEIVRLESVGNYCQLYTADHQCMLMAVSLGTVLKHMKNFLRIHAKHAVNERYIKARFAPIPKPDTGERYLLLTTGEKLPWSRRKLTDKRKDPNEAYRYRKEAKRKPSLKSRVFPSSTPPHESDKTDPQPPASQSN